eukprot:scaffold393204_cov19-Prasinocladus_malaysianus.AAC.1
MVSRHGWRRCHYVKKMLLLMSYCAEALIAGVNTCRFQARHTLKLTLEATATCLLGTQRARTAW